MKDNKWTHKVTLLTFCNPFVVCFIILYIFQIFSGILTHPFSLGIDWLFSFILRAGNDWKILIIQILQGYEVYMLTS